MKTDAQIQADVMQELKWDPSVTHEHIGVAVADSVVTLSGTVPSLIERIAAERAAQRVGGVKAVVEELKVKLPDSLQADDQSIATAIVHHLRWHTRIPDTVKASVRDGSVTLTGDVQWNYQKEAAENVVRGLTGVRGIDNMIVIRSASVQPAEVRERIEEALKRAAHREAADIGVRVQGTRVILSGKVRSFAELRDVRGVPFSIPGITTVDDRQLTIGS